MSIGHLKIAVAQINSVVGDLAGNAAKIREAATRAKAAGADILLTPELALCGYPPEDLLLRADFYRNCAGELQALASTANGIALLIGHPVDEAGERYNAASLLQNGKIQATYYKQRLPNYEVFDEVRYFSWGDKPCVVKINNVAVGINICADVWEHGAAEQAKAAGAELLLVLNASPFHMNKQEQRYGVVRDRIRQTRMAAVYCNLVGGQDELVFDGASFAMNDDGTLAYQAPLFEERLDILHYSNGFIRSEVMTPELSVEAQVYQALVLGVRDYIGKNRFPGALLGLSGGVDSALTLCIAADALGADKVRAVMMPSPYTAQMSLDDSRELIRNLGVRYDELTIVPVMETFERLLTPLFEGRAADTTEENLQARIRGMNLMALSNKFGSIVLTTGNKSEMAVGYATLYGDMAGGFAVIKDILKTFVYRLCAYRNSIGHVIPENILTRAPSAELKPNQKDQDSLPPYEVLDAIIEAYMERNESPREIIAQGYTEHDVRRVVGMLRRNEYKRRQSPVGIRVTQRGFGKDWRYPITNRFADEY
ncbi:NAD+ synthase [Uliginosibacterium gangwonense]|uniref:NAD+ synthase n=1 Tax=Uliginosibacterium gangwonense TaxID=392736 RepID=UPI000380899A|nr:NAD+ synthase [Uliginosibacterium gangwonense]